MLSPTVTCFLSPILDTLFSHAVETETHAACARGTGILLKETSGRKRLYPALHTQLASPRFAIYELHWW